jgi:hypothetical protein
MQELARRQKAPDPLDAGGIEDRDPGDVEMLVEIRPEFKPWGGRNRCQTEQATGHQKSDTHGCMGVWGRQAAGIRTGSTAQEAQKLSLALSR